jgi:hypothetical protein
MFFYIIYNINIDVILLKLWLNHYNNLGIKYGILVNKNNSSQFCIDFPLSIYQMIFYIPIKKLIHICR